MRVRIIPLIAVLSLLSGRAALAQPVSAEGGPLSDMSQPLHPDSRPVHERGRTVSDGSVGSMHSGPVRGDRRASMLSGSVSDASSGPVTSGHPMSGGGSVTENSAGAVKHDLDHSLGEQVYDAQRALDPLQERLRVQAADEAAAAAEEGRAALAVPTPSAETEEPVDTSDSDRNVRDEAPNAEAEEEVIAPVQTPADEVPADEEEMPEPTPAER